MYTWLNVLAWCVLNLHALKRGSRDLTAGLHFLVILHFFDCITDASEDHVQTSGLLAARDLGSVYLPRYPPTGDILPRARGLS